MADLSFPTWLRPDFVPGGGDAFVQYAIFGDFDLSVPIDRAAYRSERVPEGLELLLYDRHKNPAAFHALFKTQPWALAAAHQPAAAETAIASEQMVLLRGYVRDPQTLNYLRDAIGIVQYLFDRGGQLCYDQMLLQFWTHREWNTTVFTVGRPIAHNHVLIIRQPDPTGREWIYTRGLRLFGRPDLSVHHVGSKYHDRIIELLNRYIEYQVNGGTIQAGDVVTLDGLPPNGECVPDERIDHPDFHNRHVEIIWPKDALS